ncbi:hypothetical protein IAR55_000468 [Kwoniella newhampshirensis]|uniref:Secreted protein n=1 Tax=Kwoniella newhampshirensis TaxID=1651941 RepID=A0AAW0Z6S5_9TREE
MLVFATLLLFIAIASAKICNVTVPTSALVGETIQATLQTQAYIQHWDDFGVIWGLVRAEKECIDCIGFDLGYNNLYNDGIYPLALGNMSYWITLPDTVPGKYLFTAAVPHLTGAYGSTGFTYLNQTIELVAATGNDVQ